MKNLSERTTVDRHVDLEIFRVAQDDVVVVYHSERSEESPRCVCSLFMGYIFVTRERRGGHKQKSAERRPTRQILREINR